VRIAAKNGQEYNVTIRKLATGAGFPRSWRIAADFALLGQVLRWAYVRDISDVSDH
jgi:hypothetical protein